eukprot:TRINITY_DN12012_c0_g1_i1.p1 TRINITY_DN12012_c0_g1~~TRINITY_DN12012_c0_g1_i1.p1  ORF type:complete len:378 (-),score=51.79 TRINITY_DN12012_c0_g1_i1:29-1162(-)
MSGNTAAANAEAAFADSLHTIVVNHRTIEFALSGDEAGEPVLLFYPMGASRSLAILFDHPARRVGARLICLNRPGMGKTTPAPEGTAGSHLEAHCKDAIACLNHLAYPRVRVLFLCAGAPFALVFRARYPERTRGRLVGCSAWVSPTDCPAARLVYRLSAGLPTAVLSALAGTFANSANSMQSTNFAQSMPFSSSLAKSLPFSSPLLRSSSLLDSLNTAEAEMLIQQSPDESKADIEFLFACCSPLASTIGQETGGEGADAAVLVEGAGAWGIDYKKLGCSIVLLHGEDDTTVPVECVEWMQTQVPGLVVHRVPGAQHGETMLLGISAALRILVPRRPHPPPGTNIQTPDIGVGTAKAVPAMSDYGQIEPSMKVCDV